MLKFAQTSLVLTLTLIMAILAAPAYAQSFEPPVAEQENWDWVQLVSGEWLKGDIIAMYEEEMEFESDVLDTLMIDWEDVQQLRSAGPMAIRLNGQTDREGRLLINGDEGSIAGEPFLVSQIMTITPGGPQERLHWSVQYQLGATYREGNSDQYDLNTKLEVQRRTIANRFVFDYSANYTENDDITTADNRRSSAAWDFFLSERIFLRPVFGEYLSDNFQNIAYKYNIGTGLGYQLIDRPSLEWRIIMGPAYQETRFNSVSDDDDKRESTPAWVVTSNISWDFNKDIELYHDYNANFVNDRSGRYTHFMTTGINLDITSLVDLDLSLVWERTELPKANDDGVIPEQDDYRFIVAFGLDL
ncbi:MAG: DUF481 domain-containing protein [Pseudomonadales bacterium]|nr:DUF481 domain-containing protein [Pseudomonadales bacterium]